MGNMGLSHRDGQSKVSVQIVSKLSERIIPVEYYDRKYNEICRGAIRKEESLGMGMQNADEQGDSPEIL